MKPNKAPKTDRKPAITEHDLVERLFQASSNKGPTSAADFSDIPPRLGVHEVRVNVVAANFLYRAGIVTKDELPDTMTILKAKREQFDSADAAQKARERELREKDPGAPVTRRSTYLRFVRGSLLTQLNVLSDVAFEHAGSDVFDYSVLSVTDFLGRVIGERGQIVEVAPTNILELPGSLPEPA